MAAIEIRRPGLLTTVQDLGRRGYEHWGVAVGGAADEYGARWANRLAHNPPDAALLEVTVLGPELVVEGDVLAGLAGADLGAQVDGRPWTPGASVMLRSGSLVRFSGPRRGARAYLAFAGGLCAEPVLGSRSTDVEAGFGGFEGRALRAGDRIATGPAPPQDPLLAPVSTLWRPSVVGVVPRPGWASLLAPLLERPVTVSPRSNRVGIRLEERLAVGGQVGGSEVSEGIAIGSVEVTPAGEVLILLKARGSVGGYPVLGHVPTAYWPALAQYRPGEQFRLRAMTLDAAHDARIALQTRLARAPARGRGWPLMVSAPRDGVIEAVGGRPDGEGERGPSPWRGRLRTARGRVEVSLPGPGRILAVPAAPGQAVRAGDPLVWWEPAASGPEPEPR